MIAMLRAALAACRNMGAAAAMIVLAGCAGSQPVPAPYTAEIAPPPPPVAETAPPRPPVAETAPPRPVAAETAPSRPPAVETRPSRSLAAEIGPPRPLAQSRIRPTDKLDVRVLFEPDLSSPDVRVDAGGLVSLPLVGDVKAAGLSTQELAGIVRTRLLDYVKDPRVTVSVLSTTGDHVVVEGSVTEPGVFDIPGSAGLLEVLARAKGPTRTAALSQVTVFRSIDGRRAGAVFNVGRIRRGLDQEPQLYPGDTVVVGFSFLKGAYRDFLTVAPGAITLFRFY